MSLYRLEVFVCLAKHLHVTRAADELNISQPSVSRHLRLLEVEFGAALHRKSSRGIELTPKGEEFLKGAESVLAQYHRLKKSFTKTPPRNERSYLKIASSFAASTRQTQASLWAFRRANPEVGIVTLSGTSEELEKLVLSGEIDVALITASNNLDSLVYAPCGKAEVVPFVSSNHPLAKKEMLSISELMTVPLVVRTRTGGRTTRTWQRLQKLIDGRGPLNVVLYCDSQRTLRHAVRSGSGLGFAYRNYLARELKQGILKEVTIEGFTNHYDQFIVYSNKKQLSEAAGGFLVMLQRKVTKLRRQQRLPTMA